MKLSTQVSTLCPPSQSNSVNLEELFSKVLLSGLMTKSDRRRIQAALLENAVTEENLMIINRLVYGVRRGFVKLVA
jgi:hypothetical protein